MIYDILVVGGGIHGVAIARDAVLRGLKVLLLESGDLASGTSSRTSKLAHGGIRYLESGQFGLVRESLRERGLLAQLAPAYVRPLPFLIPHYNGVGRRPGWISLGLWLYAMLAGYGRMQEHRRVGPDEARALEPSLRAEGLEGASLYWDAQIDDAAYVAAVAEDAAGHGAEIKTYTPVRSLTWRDGAWDARFRDAIDQSDGGAQARCVVNAAGPWVDEVRAMALGREAAGPSLRRSRGTHVVYPAFTGGQALLLITKRDKRVFFAIPWGTHTLIGTTDVDDESPPGALRPPASDIRYLIQECDGYLKREAGAPVRAFVGVRSLTRGASVNPWANPREHRLVAEGAMLSVIGGKYTTHRSMAAQTVDRVAEMLRIRVAPSRTDSLPIGEGREERLQGLRSQYPGRLELPGGLSLEEAQVADATQAGRARRLSDVLYRRSRLWLDARAIAQAAEPASRWMASSLGWGEDRRRAEVELVTKALAEERGRIQEATAT